VLDALVVQVHMHRNPGRARRDVPNVVLLQSAWFDDHQRRLVAPLLFAEAGAALRRASPMPRFEIEGRAVVLDRLPCHAVLRHLLNDPVASLADDENATRIIAAMDEVPSRAHR
jgi:hypothetical protein